MSSNKTQSDNPSDICTWQSISACDDCPILGELQCRFRWHDLLSFFVNFAPYGIASIAGMVRSGAAWLLLGWLSFAILFFFGWEARVLCSHCPYWAEGGRILHCHANFGVFRIWRYRPDPMSRSEKAQFLIGALILIAFPFPFMLLGEQYLLVLVALSAAVAFALNLIRNTCVRCVNFSCPLNRVPKPIVDAYLRRNPVIRQAWEATGYSLGESTPSEHPDR